MFDTWLWVAFLVFWLASLAVFVPHTRVLRHPAFTPLTAYLAFACVFSLAAFVIFGAIVAVDHSVWRGLPLETWYAALMVLAMTFVPSFSVATAAIRREPHQRQDPPSARRRR